MNKLNFKKITIVLIHAFIVWALCGATIAIGRAVTTVELTLRIHAIAAPIFACLVSMVYYKNFNYISPILTAFIFLLFVIAMDAGLVAPVFEKRCDQSLFYTKICTYTYYLVILIDDSFSRIRWHQNPLHFKS